MLVDAGVQGGIHPRWEVLGDQLHVYGFDALEEAIRPLAAKAGPAQHYFARALGDEEGERMLHVQRVKECSSFFLDLYGMLDAAFDLLAAFPDALAGGVSTEQAAACWCRAGPSSARASWRECCGGRGTSGRRAACGVHG